MTRLQKFWAIVTIANVAAVVAHGALYLTDRSAPSPVSFLEPACAPPHSVFVAASKARDEQDDWRPITEWQIQWKNCFASLGDNLEAASWAFDAAADAHIMGDDDAFVTLASEAVELAPDNVTYRKMLETAKGFKELHSRK